MTISIEAKHEEQPAKIDNRLTLRLVDEDGNVIFDRAIPEDETETRDVFLLALYCVIGYRTGKRITGSGAI